MSRPTVERRHVENLAAGALARISQAIGFLEDPAPACATEHWQRSPPIADVREVLVLEQILNEQQPFATLQPLVGGFYVTAQHGSRLWAELGHCHLNEPGVGTVRGMVGRSLFKSGQAAQR